MVAFRTGRLSIPDALTIEAHIACSISFYAMYLLPLSETNLILYQRRYVE